MDSSGEAGGERAGDARRTADEAARAENVGLWLVDDGGKRLSRRD
jgi:hypothetical protein